MCLAIPGKILELMTDPATGAIVSVVGVRRRVDLGLLEDDMPAVGDWVLIHVGFAMSKISEARRGGSDARCSRCSARTQAAMEEAAGYGLGDHGDGQEPT